jgi:hypothetical protein
MDGKMQLDPDFSEFIACCVAREVRFLIVGGYALAAHGHPRYTKDLDVWILTDPVNAKRLTEALADFGFGSLDLSPADFLDPGVVIQLGYPPKRIDILTSVDGLDFEECHPNHVTAVIGAVRVPVIDLESLRRNKLAAGRPQDLADLAALDTPLP